MREFFYAAMLSCTGAITGLLLFIHPPGTHVPTPPAAIATSMSPDIADRALPAAARHS